MINPEEKTNILGSRLVAVEYGIHHRASRTAAPSRRPGNRSQGGSLEAALASPQGEALRKLAEHAQEAARAVCRGRSRTTVRTIRSIARRKAQFESGGSGD